MKVVSQVMTESKWQDDKDIIDCQSCKAAFSVAKRKVDGLCLLLFLSALTYYCLCSIYYSITVEIVEVFSVQVALTIQCNWPPVLSQSVFVITVTSCYWRELRNKLIYAS